MDARALGARVLVLSSALYVAGWFRLRRRARPSASRSHPRFYELAIVDERVHALEQWVASVMIYLAAVVPTVLRSLSGRWPAIALATSG